MTNIFCPTASSREYPKNRSAAAFARIPLRQLALPLMAPIGHSPRCNE